MTRRHQPEAPPVFCFAALNSWGNTLTSHVHGAPLPSAPTSLGAPEHRSHTPGPGPHAGGHESQAAPAPLPAVLGAGLTLLPRCALLRRPCLLGLCARRHLRAPCTLSQLASCRPAALGAASGGPPVPNSHRSPVPTSLHDAPSNPCSTCCCIRPTALQNFRFRCLPGKPCTENQCFDGTAHLRCALRFQNCNSSLQSLRSMFLHACAPAGTVARACMAMNIVTIYLFTSSFL